MNDERQIMEAMLLETSPATEMEKADFCITVYPFVNCGRRYDLVLMGVILSGFNF